MFDLNYFNTAARLHSDNFFIAGCDEVGRGPLAGPVVAACASIKIKNYDQKEIKTLLRNWSKLGITDSKKLTGSARLEILQKLFMASVQVNQIYTHQYSKNISINILIKEIQFMYIYK